MRKSVALVWCLLILGLSTSVLAQEGIVLLDSDREHGDRLRVFLERYVGPVSLYRDGQSGLAQIKKLVPKLVIIHQGLSVTPEEQVMAAMRKDPRLAKTFVLILAPGYGEAPEVADTDESIEVQALRKMGVDDFMWTRAWRPDRIKVFEQRVKALLKREREPEDTQIVRSKHILMNLTEHRALLGDEELPLTPTEFALLLAFIEQPGRTLTRAELIEKAECDETYERTIDVHIRALRQKLGTRATMIETERGQGYRFNENAVPLETTKGMSEKLPVAGTITFDQTEMRADIDGQDLELSSTEFTMFLTLFRRPGEVTILNKAKNYTNRQVQDYISKLRLKLGARGHLIETVRGQGYRFALNHGLKESPSKACGEPMFHTDSVEDILVEAAAP